MVRLSSSGHVRRAAVLALFVAATSWTHPSRGDDRAVATELFNAGRDSMNAGDFTAACPKLAESVRLDPTVGALAKLASCEEHEARLVQARGHWEQALNLARSLHDPREGEVAGELGRIDAVVPKLLLSTTEALPRGATIRIDDLSLGTGSVGVPLPIEPGAHTVTVSAPGVVTWSTSFHAASDGTTTTLVLPKLEPQAPPAVPTSPPEASHPVVRSTVAPAAPRSPTSLRIGALAASGAGFVALGVGSILGLEALAKRSDAHCQGAVCPNDASAETLGDAKSSASAATIAFIAGGLLVGAGVALWLVAPGATNHEAIVYLGPTVGGLTLGGRWQ